MLHDTTILRQVRDAFYAEQTEHSTAASDLLLELERGVPKARRRTLLNELFRHAHSMKGGARAANLPAIEQIAHAIEDLFSAARAGALELSPDVCDPVYAAFDAISALAAQSAMGQPISLSAYQPILDQLAAVRADYELEEERPRSAAPPPALPAAKPHENGAPHTDTPYTTPDDASADEPPTARREQADTTVRLSTAMLDGLLSETSELLTSAVRARTRANDARALIALSTRWRRLWRQVTPIVSRARRRAPAVSQTVRHLDAGQRTVASAVAPRAASAADHDLARLTTILDQMQALFSEVEQQISAHAHQLADDHDQLADVTGRIHDQVWRTRLLPVATLQPALRLQLREMARALGKPATLVFDDGGAAADRPVLDQLREVLVQLLRNALDHGVESPEVRAARGKPAEATIHLTVAVRGEQLVLTLEDDGAGLDIEAIRAQALHSGLLSPADAQAATERVLTDIIFQPGFSTRPQVGDLSGRGVGLDIVRTQVERMRGEVSVQSSAGHGCAFTLIVPLSLASSVGLWLQVGMSTFIIPLEHVRQILAITPADIQILEGRPVCVIRERPTALISLAALLGLPEAPGAAGQAAGTRLALLLGSGDRQVALLVEAVLGERTLVAQRLPAPLMQAPLLSGATILEDGQVVPILDVVDLVQYALGTPPAGRVNVAPTATTRRTILVVDDSITTRTLEKNILHAAGYNVVLATDGQEALSTLARLLGDGGCDLMLSDVDMPRLNGYELTSRVRADGRLRHLPIVLVTSLDTPDQRARGVAAGADAYIVKRAFDQQALLETIERLIGQE